MVLHGRIAPTQSHWKGQRGILVFHLEESSIKGLPEDVEAGEAPLRVRVNYQLTKIEGQILEGKDVTVVGTLVLNEVYKGRHLPPHIDAATVRVA